MAPTLGFDGSEILNRITWTADEDGTARQVWEDSGDGGASWGTIFDRLYHPVQP